MAEQRIQTWTARGRGRRDRVSEQRTLGRAGLIAALVPLIVPSLLDISARAVVYTGYDALPGLLPLALLFAALMLDGALSFTHEPRLGRVLVLLGGLGYAGLATVGLRDVPAQAMALLLAVVLFGAWIYNAPEVSEPWAGLRGSRAARARMAARGCIAAVFLFVGFGLGHAPWDLVYPLASLAITIGLAWRAGGRTLLRRVDMALLFALVLGLSGVAAVSGHTDLAALALLPIPIALVVLLRSRATQDSLYVTDWADLLLEQPARLLVGTFLIGGLISAVVLTLPPCSTGEHVTLLDAAFTSFSAICVTGLTVLDTATVYSFWGQAAIALTIQIGGLGIMAFSTAAMVLLGQRLSLRGEGAAVELLGSDRETGLDVALRRVLLVTFVSESIGAVLLAVLFRVHGDAWAEACWRGVFTSISAYCNAGFGLQTTNLIPYQQNPLILHVVGLLVIVGGLGPLVVVSVPDLLRRRPLKLHVRIVMITTAILLVVPAVLIGALEWQQSLAGLSVADRLHNAWFQSLTTRTAGFNSVDFAAMTPATLTLVEALMFIGGSPASTAGGIKTTTVFVLVMAVDAVARLRSKVVWGGWTIPHPTIYRAAAVVTLGALSVVFGVFSIQLTQGMDTQMAIFEVVSALGTVGLSIGGTAQLDSVGKLIIIICMFLGRIAPLSLFLMFSRPSASVGTWSFPEQNVSVG